MTREFILFAALPLVFATYYPSCRTPEVSPTMGADLVRLEELWRAPASIAAEDLFNGRWGPEYAPDPDAAYRFVKPKTRGVNPGMTVADPLGRSWSVKQSPHDGRAAEGPVEVVLSRVLAAVGYHQPPVYYLPSFTLVDTFGSRVEGGGRFRLQHRDLREVDTWSWQQNPFVGTEPYQGLLVILMMFNSSDLKNSNNTIYQYRADPDRVERWYVVRDLGTALGDTARMRPERSNPELFDSTPFVTGVDNGFVLFGAYRGWHAELVQARITEQDVRWAGNLLAQLTDEQWHDAFRAGGYDRPTADRFIHRLTEKIAQAQSVGHASR
jgi:hypothetical protein